MSLRYLYTIDDFKYEKISIPITVHHDKESGSKALYRFEFEYKGCRVYDWYYHEDSNDAYSWTRLYCKMIDQYGLDGVGKFKICKEKLSEIKDRYILVDNKVFKFKKAIMDIHPHKIYSMQIKMTDGKILDGDSIMNRDFYIKDKDEYSYDKTFDNLCWSVKNYFKNNKVIPCEEYFLEKETNDYNGLLLEYHQMLK